METLVRLACSHPLLWVASRSGGVAPTSLATSPLLFQRRHWHPTLVLLPGKSHGRRNLVGCSPRGRYELDMTVQLHFHFSLSCIGEGNGNPLQCSCLENPRDGGAWWAAIYGVSQSRTWLKWLSSSSSLCYSHGTLFLCPCFKDSVPQGSRPCFSHSRSFSEQFCYCSDSPNDIPHPDAVFSELHIGT